MGWIMIILAGGQSDCDGVLDHLRRSVSGFGRLPGDIVVKREDVSFCFPVTTCLLFSLILTLVMILFRRS